MSLLPNNSSDKRKRVPEISSEKRPRAEERPSASQLPPFPRIRGTSSSTTSSTTSSTPSPAQVPAHVKITEEKFKALLSTLDRIHASEEFYSNEIDLATYVHHSKDVEVPVKLAYQLNKMFSDVLFQLTIVGKVSITETMSAEIQNIQDELKKLQ